VWSGHRQSCGGLPAPAASPLVTPFGELLTNEIQVRAGAGAPALRGNPACRRSCRPAGEGPRCEGPGKLGRVATVPPPPLQSDNETTSVCATACARGSRISPWATAWARCWRTDRASSGPFQLGVRRHHRCPVVTPRHSRLASSNSTRGSTSPPTAASKASWMRSASLGLACPPLAFAPTRAA